jgi:signal transduction histidine kinase
VEKRLDRSIGKYRLDGELLRQALLNLVLNAIQAMPGGGALIAESRLRDGMLEVRIADTGPGIAPENRKKLFAPFFTTKKEGTGLGLAITFRIIQNHNGTIEAESWPGKGAVFIVRIPVA